MRFFNALYNAFESDEFCFFNESNMESIVAFAVNFASRWHRASTASLISHAEIIYDITLYPLSEKNNWHRNKQNIPNCFGIQKWYKFFDRNNFNISLIN